MQYEVQVRDGAKCGGAYVKVREKRLCMPRRGKTPTNPGSSCFVWLCFALVTVEGGRERGVGRLWESWMCAFCHGLPL